MAIQKFTGRIIGMPKMLETANTHRKVVHVRIGFMPEVKISGKLPEFGENAVSDIQLSFWDENFQNAIMEDANSLVGKMVTGYCDNITQRNQFYNGTGYAFVLDAKGKPNAPQIQVIHAAGPTAPVARV
jgi:hypothetical protein